MRNPKIGHPHGWKRYLFLAMALTGLSLILFYPSACSNPNGHLYEAKGDAIKNYFTYASHIKNDSTSTHFQQFNYPFGEYLLFTDATPVLAISVQYIKETLWPGIERYSVGIFNGSMLLSYFLAVFFLYLLGSQYNLPPWVSCIAAVSIVFLSPQAERMHFHFNLSYSFFLLAFWYLVNSYRLSSQRKWQLPVYTLLLFLALYTHVYYFALVAFFTLSWVVVYYRWNHWKTSLYHLLAIAIPYMAFSIINAQLDTKIMRSNNPDGFLYFTAELKTIFLTHQGPLLDFFNTLFTVGHQKGEGRAYIGLGMTLIIGYLIAKGIQQLIKRKYTPLRDFLASDIAKLLLIGSFSLLLSFGFPFNTGFDFLLDLFPPIRQIRSLGRFAWIFYYIATFSGFLLLYRYRKHIPYAPFLIVLLATANFLESLPYQKGRNAVMAQNENTLHPDYYNDHFPVFKHLVSQERYSAMIALPFYYIGNNTVNYYPPDFSRVQYHSMTLAYHADIPLVNTEASRTSIPESRTMFHLLSPNYWANPLEQVFDPSARFLVVVSGDSSTLKWPQKQLLSKAQYIGKETHDNLTYFSLSPSDIYTDDGAAQTRTLMEWDTTGVHSQGYILQDTHAVVFSERWDTQPENPHPFMGKSTLEIRSPQTESIATFTLTEEQAKQEIECLFWLRFLPEGKHLIDYIIDEHSDGQTHRLVHKRHKGFEFIRGEWGYTQIALGKLKPNIRYTLSLKFLDQYKNSPAYLDNLLIKTQNSKVFWRENTHMEVNGIPF